MSGLRSRWVPMTMSTLPSRELLDDLGRLLVGLEARKPLRITGKPAIRSLNVERCCCTSTSSGRVRRPAAVLHRLERRTHGDLGLAVADVAAHEAVHRTCCSMSRLTSSTMPAGRVSRRTGTRPRARAATGCPGRTRGRGSPGARRQLDELGRDLPDRLAGAALAPGPVTTAEPVQRRLLAADVAGHLVERICRHEQPVGRLPRLEGAYSITRYSRVAPCTSRCRIST